MKISDICLIVSDVDQSIRFYQDKLGFDVNYRDNGFITFFGLGLSFAIWDSSIFENDLISQLIQSASILGLQPEKDKPVLKQIKPTMLSFQLENRQAVDKTYENFLNKGIEFLSKPKIYPWNDYAAYFLDPDGYLWSIYALLP